MQSTYVLLDRSHPDAPTWRLLEARADRRAELNEVGEVTVEEFAHVIFWTTVTLDHIVSLRPLPGPLAYTVREVTGDAA